MGLLVDSRIDSMTISLSLGRFSKKGLAIMGIKIKISKHKENSRWAAEPKTGKKEGGVTLFKCNGGKSKAERRGLEEGTGGTVKLAD